MKKKTKELDAMLMNGIYVENYHIGFCDGCENEQWCANDTNRCVECGEVVEPYED